MNNRSKPKTRDELTGAGYLLSGSAKCKGCGAAIEWWINPKARRVPFDVLKDDTLEPHWDHCPQVKEFRPKGPGTSRLQKAKKRK